MDEHEVPYEVDGHVATITLNRPHRRNAISVRLLSHLTEAIEAGAGGVLRTRTIPTVVLHEMDTPIIAAINGAAAGYGVELGLVNRVVPDSELLATAREWADDFAESLAAFAEGRSPDFRGR